ncbi:autotransporter [Bartonella bovis m02]|uniref:Autotransporter n=2 Tax=Bartonella bovis TaxID=155194 RepID=N6VSE4_9HYPH|nr:autotransporter [Bartonella bovis m02]
MVMGCVFKHHVYLCVVSTAMLAGLSLITSHTKVYAQNQNCTIADSNRNGVVNGPIVCSGRKGVLTTSGSNGNEIEINMSGHPDKEAVKIMSGANIMIMKKLMVTVTKWSGKNLPVIKVDKGGKLMLLGGVEVDVTGVGMKKVIEVNGGMLMLDGVGMIEGKGSGEVMLVNNGGTLMMMGESKITIKGDGSGKGVQMGSMEKLMMMRDVTFENVSEGINIEGSMGGVMVMGMGTGMGKTTMTVKNSGSGVVGIKVQDTKAIDATVMGLKIEGSGGSKGVEFMGSVTGKGGTLMLNMVEISGFEKGVSASGKGMVNIMGNSRITFKGGTGLEVKGGASAELMRTKIVGSGTGTGVVMGSEGVLEMTSVDISEVGVGGSASNGKLVMMGTTITVKEGGTGLSVSGKAMATLMGNSAITIKENGTGLEVKDTANATMMGGTIKGTDGKGYGVKMMGTGTVEMDGVGISNVEKGVSVSKGTVEMMGTTIMVKSGGTGTGYGVGVGVSGGAVSMMGGAIMVTSGGTGKGNYGVGVGVSGGSAELMRTEIVGKGGTGVYMGSTETLKMTSVDISGFEKGVSASKGKLEMNMGSIKVKSGVGNGNYGVGLWGTADATLMGTEIKGDGKGYGVNGQGTGVIMEGGTVTMKRVWISQVEKGVEVKSGTVMMKGGSIKGMGTGYGVIMGGGTVTMMDKVWISNVEKGVEAMGTGTLKMMGNSAIIFTGGEGSYGVKVGGTATAHLTDVKIRGTSGQGTGVIMEGGTVKMDGVKISDVGMGVEVKSGTVEMKGGWIEFTSGAGNGYGVGVGVSGGVVTMMGTKIVGTSGGTGVYVGSGVKMLMDKVWIEGGGKGVSVGGGMLEMNMGSITIKEGAGNYGVGVWGTADATLMGTVIVGSGKGYGVYGVQMTGTGKVEMNMVEILQVGVGVYASNGRLKMNMGKIEFTSGAGNGYGVGVGVSGMASVELMRTEIVGDGKGGSKGVIMESGGEMLMDGVKILQVGKGVEVMGSGRLVMMGGEIGFKGEHGVTMSGGQALFYGVSITGSGDKSTGVGVVMDGKMLMMDGVDISGVKTGVEVSEGNLVMHKGSIGFTGNYGVTMSGGQALFYGVSITGSGREGTGTGVYVGSSGKIVMKDVTMSGVGVGAWVTNGGAMWLGGTHLKDVQNGMIVTQGSTVRMEGGEITFKGSYGVYLDKGGAALKDVKMTYMGGNDAVDFMTVQGGKVIAKDIQIYGNGKGQGMKVNNGGYAVLVRPTYTNVDKGMAISGGAVRVFGGSVEFKGKYGVSLTRGIATLKGVKMTYKGGSSTADFMTVRGGKMMAESVKINGNGKGQGMKVNGGRVVLIKPSYTNIYNGMTVLGGHVQVEGGSLEFKGKHGVYLSKSRVALKDVKMTYAGNDNDVDFIKVEGGTVMSEGIQINGNSYGQGVKVNGGYVVLIRPSLNKVRTGVTIQNAEVTMISSSINFTGGYGVNLNVGKAILNKVEITHTGNNSADLIKARGKGSKLVINRATIKGNANKGNGLNATDDAKITLLQSKLTGVAKGIYIESGTINIKGSNITINGKNSYGISLWGGEKSVPQKQQRSTRSLTMPHHISKTNKKPKVAFVNLTHTTLKVPNNTAIHGYAAKSLVALKKSEVSGKLLLKAENGSSVVIIGTDQSSLIGGSYVDHKSKALLHLTNKAKWVLTSEKNQKNSSSSISGIVLKDSIIIFEKQTTENYQTLHIGNGSHGVYFAQGNAQLYLNVQTDHNGSLNEHKTDRVLIHGNVSGTTKIHIHDALDSEEEKIRENSVKQSVSIVQVSGSAKKDSFILHSGYIALNNSPYQYHLVAYGPDSDKAADSKKRLVEGKGDFWDFRLENKYIDFDTHSRHMDKPLKPAVVPQVPTYLLLPNALFYAGLMDVNNQTELLGTMVTSFDPFFSGKPAFFVRGYGGSHNYISNLSSSEYGYNGKFGYHAIEVAALLNRLESEQNSAFIGVIGTYGKLSLQPQDVEKSKKSTFNNWSLTAYASLQHNTGFYVNGLLSYGLSRGDVETLARGKTARITSRPLRASLTGGKTFLTGYEGLIFEPQMQLVYQYLMFNSARDVDGFSVNMGSPNRLTARLGGQLAQEFASTKEDNSVSFYGKLHLMSSFGGKQFVQFKDTFQLGVFGSSMEAGVGVQAQLSSQIAIHGDVVYQQKLTKAGLSGSTFSGGLRYRF